MKAGQRKAWVQMAVSEGYQLCAVCRYHDVDFGEFVCAHPWQVIRDKVEDNAVEPGNDCWAFRPDGDGNIDHEREKLQGWMRDAE